MKNTHDILYEFSRKIKRILGSKLVKVILYGSYARGDYHDNSDIDVMILTTLTDEEIDQIETEIFDLAYEFQLAYGIDISVIVKNEEHFNTSKTLLMKGECYFFIKKAKIASLLK